MGGAGQYSMSTQTRFFHLVATSNLIEGISFLAYYYFDARGLFLIALVPPSIDEGIKTERLLEAKYGSPEREQRMGR